jgi:hypothetical protein
VGTGDEIAFVGRLVPEDNGVAVLKSPQASELRINIIKAI